VGPVRRSTGAGRNRYAPSGRNHTLIAQRIDRFRLAMGAFAPLATRRGLGAVFVALVVPSGSDTSAKKGKKKLKRNKYGCVNVGGKCRGKDKNCCSGRCQGKKPAKGKPDKSRCVAHDTGTLVEGEGGCRGVADDSCGPGDDFCTTTTGEDGRCWLTTGNAGSYGVISDCVPCSKDTECIDACGEGAACIACPGGCPETDTYCFGTAACG
jgi:hypothetical protein